MNQDQSRYFEMMNGKKTAIEVMNEYITEGHLEYLTKDGFKPEERNDFKKLWPARSLMREFYVVGITQKYFNQKGKIFEIGNEIDGECGEKIRKDIMLFKSGILTTDGKFYHVGNYFHEQVKLWLKLNRVNVEGAVSISR